MGNKTLWWIIGGSVALGLLLAATNATTNAPFGMMTATSGSVALPMMDANEASFDERIADPMMVTKPYPIPYQTAGETAAETDQKIIKTGYLDVEVIDVGETVSKLSALASGVGGFVQDSSVSEREDGTHYGNVTVRVPSDRFESTMTEIKTHAVTVMTESSEGQDVTEQYTDLEAQLRNAKAQEEEYLKILSRANTVEEILQVQSYLSNVRYTIESLEGRTKYLLNQTSYSTISVTLSEETSIRIPTKDFRFGNTVSQAGQALVAILQNLAVAAIWLVILGGGIVVPVALIIWGTTKLLAKRRRR